MTTSELIDAGRELLERHPSEFRGWSEQIAWRDAVAKCTVGEIREIGKALDCRIGRDRKAIAVERLFRRVSSRLDAWSNTRF